MSKRHRIAFNLDLQWPYKRHTAVFAGAQRYAIEQDWETIIDEFVESSLGKRRKHFVPYDGIIGRVSAALCERLQKESTPVVNVWASSPARDLLPGVFADYAASGRMKVEHLLDRGFRNFAVISRRYYEERLETEEVCRFVQASGFQCDSLLIPNGHTDTESKWRMADDAINRWMDGWKLPIGVIFSRDILGRQVAQKCLERGWLVPQDVGIMTGQNEVAICEQPSPSLSSIELGYEKVGYEAAKLLDQLMQSRRKTRKEH